LYTTYTKSPNTDANYPSAWQLAIGSEDCKITFYAAQFRVHIFTILICGGYARILCWDRSGAVVTAAFPYHSERHLGNFFWRYDLASPEERGVDISVSMPSQTEGKLARQHLKCGLKDSLIKFAVHSDEDGETYHFIGSKPTFKGTVSPTGRATRTFVI
jgi:hypothetical protein